MYSTGINKEPPTQCSPGKHYDEPDLWRMDPLPHLTVQ